MAASSAWVAEAARAEGRYGAALRGLYALIGPGGGVTSTKATRVPRDAASPHERVMRAGLRSLGLTQAALARLRVVHVTGTKGKGSTCALAEAALRAAGLRTGMYTSPHLCSPRERIRVDGRPLSEEAFADAFWTVSALLLRAEDAAAAATPGFFEFLTLMAFHVFVHAAVDVAVVEVGVGGRTDATNVVDAPAVCAVATVGIDHTELLGPTRTEIAWEKAGIFRKGVPAVVAPGQMPDALASLRSRAEELGAELIVVEEPLPVGSPRLGLGLDGDFQRTNAALAAAVVRTWAARCPDLGARCPDLDAAIELGFSRCVWPGRAQRIDLHWGASLFLDGAHTSESVEECARWFSTRSKASPAALLFACKDRAPAVLLSALLKLPFALVVFVQLRPAEQFRSPQLMLDAWNSLCPPAAIETAFADGAKAALEVAREFGAKSVLATGSLYLIGAMLGAVDYSID